MSNFETRNIDIIDTSQINFALATCVKNVNPTNTTKLMLNYSISKQIAIYFFQTLVDTKMIGIYSLRMNNINFRTIRAVTASSFCNGFRHIERKLYRTTMTSALIGNHFNSHKADFCRVYSHRSNAKNVISVPNTYNSPHNGKANCMVTRVN